MLSRRFVLRGLIAAPAIVAASSLMVLRGVRLIAHEPTIYLHYSGYDILEVAPVFAAANYKIIQAKTNVHIWRQSNADRDSDWLDLRIRHDDRAARDLLSY